MLHMARRRPPATPEPAPVDDGQVSGRNGANLNVWVRKVLTRTLEAYLRQTRPRPTKTSVVETALEEFFASRGIALVTEEPKP